MDINGPQSSDFMDTTVFLGIRALFFRFRSSLVFWFNYLVSLFNSGRNDWLSAHPPIMSVLTAISFVLALHFHQPIISVLIAISSVSQEIERRIQVREAQTNAISNDYIKTLMYTRRNTIRICARLAEHDLLTLVEYLSIRKAASLM
jgi:hypothetical protein